MQGTQYATKRSILCRGAFCGPTGLVRLVTVGNSIRLNLMEWITGCLKFSTDYQGDKCSASLEFYFFATIRLMHSVAHEQSCKSLYALVNKILKTRTTVNSENFIFANKVLKKAISPFCEGFISANNTLTDISKFIVS